MAHPFNVDNLTLNPKEETTFQSINQLLAALTYMRPELSELHAIDTGITMKQQIVIPGLMGMSGLKGSSTCDRQSSGATSALSEKFYEPVEIEDLFSFCPKAELDPLFKAHWDKIQEYKDIYEMEGAEDEKLFIASLLNETIMAAIWRAAWLGDKDVAAATASTSGLIAAGNAKFYNYFDGFLKQILTGVDAGKITKFALEENLRDTAEAQMNLAENRAKTVMRAVKKNADIRLKGNSNAVFYVTDEMFENYKESLIDKGENFTIEYTVEGLPSVKFDGHKVINVEALFGLNNKTYFVNNTTNNGYRLPHLVVFSTPENLRIGTLNENDFSNLESWYNRDERKQKMAYGFMMDPKLVQEEFISVAY